MPGDAIAIREMTTWDMALRAACVDSPNLLPFSSNIGMPLVSSLVELNNYWYGKNVKYMYIICIYSSYEILPKWLKTQIHSHQQYMLVVCFTNFKGDIFLYWYCSFNYFNIPLTFLNVKCHWDMNNEYWLTLKDMYIHLCKEHAITLIFLSQHYYMIDTSIKIINIDYITLYNLAMVQSLFTTPLTGQRSS